MGPMIAPPNFSHQRLGGGLRGSSVTNGSHTTSANSHHPMAVSTKNNRYSASAKPQEPVLDSQSGINDTTLNFNDKDVDFANKIKMKSQMMLERKRAAQRKA